MLSPTRRSSLVATLAIFAALYAVLGMIPLSELVFGRGFLTASKLIAPLIGMLFGPVLGGLTAILGDMIDVVFNRIVLDAFGIPVIISDVAIVLTAGLAFSGQRKLAMGLPLFVLALYFLDPVSVWFVDGIPFVGYHLVAFAFMAAVLFLESRSKIGRLNPIFLAGVVFGAQLCGQLSGTLAGEFLQVQVYNIYTPLSWQQIVVPAFFWLYPVERTVFTILGTLIAVPVLRTIYRSMSSSSTASG